MTIAGRLLRRFRRSERGSVSAEAVLWFGGMVLVSAFMVDATTIFHTQSTVLRVMQDGNRNLSIGRLVTAAETESYIEARLAAISTRAQATSTINASGDIVTTSVRLPVADAQLIGLFGSLNGMEITVSSKHLIENWGA